MIHVATHALGLAVLAAVAWLSGSVLLARLGDVGRFRHLASLCLGLVWWTSALFVLAAAGFLRPWGLVAAAVPLAAAAVPLRDGRWWRRSARAPSPRTAETLFGVFLGGVFLLTFFLAVSPRISWDADVYHLTLARLYLESGGFRPVPMSVYSNWPLATELLYGAAMLAGDYMLAKALHLGFGLAVVYAFYVALPRPAAALASALFLANAVVAFELRVAYVDLAYTFFFLSGFIFLEKALEEREDRAGTFLLLAGLSGGLMAGSKVTGILGAALIGAWGLPRIAKRLGWRPFLLRFAMPVAALWLPWLVKAYAYTGNPVYPFLHRLLGGPDWSAALTERFAAWQRSTGMGRDPLDYLLLPVRVALSGGRGYDRFDGEISPFWLVVVPLAVVLGRRDPLARRALAVGGLFFVLWAATSQQMRLVLPALALFALAGGIALGGLPERAPRFRLGGLVLGVAALLVVTVHGPYLAGGVRTLAAFAAHRGDLAETVFPEHLRFVDENLPADARLLLVDTNLGFFCRRDYLADSFFEASQIADWLGGAGSVSELRRRLDERAVTHLVVDTRPRVPNLPAALARLVADPRQADLLFRSADGNFVVLELR